MIANAHTVIHPRTMMIHFNNTPSTYRAMMSTRGFEGITSVGMERDPQNGVRDEEVK